MPAAKKLIEVARPLDAINRASTRIGLMPTAKATIPALG